MWRMKRLLLLFLAVLIWRDSSGLAVWNQKPAQYWQGGSLSSVGGQLRRPGVPTNDVQAVTGTSGSTQVPSGSTGPSADLPNTFNLSTRGTVTLKPQISTNLLAQSQTAQLNIPAFPSPSGGQSVSLQQGSGLGLSRQYAAQPLRFQGFAGSPQATSTFGFQNQAFPSLASSQGVSSGSASASQQESFDQSASGSSWFVPLRQGFSPVPQTQTLRPVPQVFQGSLPQSQVSQASPQGEAGVSASPGQQQRYDQSTSGSSWFSLGRRVPATPGQLAPFPPIQTLRPISQVVQGSVSPVSPQGLASLSASQAQSHYDQSSSWVASQVQRPAQSSTAVQAQLPGATSGNVPNLFTNAQGTYGLQSSGSSSVNTQPQRPSSISTQFQPSQYSAQVFQGALSSGSSKWLNVMPSGFNPSWSSVTPSAFVPATNNPYASPSKVVATSANAKFHSTGLGSALQPSTVTTTNAAAGLSSLSHTSRPSSVVSGQHASPSALPSQNTWQSTGPSQSVRQGSASTFLPAAPLNPSSDIPSRVPIFYPGTPSSFSFVPSQASDAPTQTSVMKLPMNLLTLNTPGTSSGASVSKLNSAVKG